MNDRSVQARVMLSISAVERDTGLSKDTLRVWERRYGFPNPERDAFGERSYPLEQVDRLRIIRRLMDIGHRPGKIIALSVERLQELAAETIAPPQNSGEITTGQDDLQRYIELVKAHQVAELRSSLSQASLRLGLDRFILEVAAPLNRQVGDAWARGYFEVFEEHLYTESMQVVLRNAISNIPQSGKRPYVLLTTFPNEAHGLGLLMAEAIMALEGAHCLSLGIQTPVWDIVLAARSQRIDVVAVSFSPSVTAATVTDGLTELRAKLPADIEIWAGGSHPILTRRPPADVHVLSELSQIHARLQAWRAEHPIEH
jgi:DNA-binding transcriptional MerR regulator/methylmalonyl-CoA mutase cobalamin-binding subunit